MNYIIKHEVMPQSIAGKKKKKIFYVPPSPHLTSLPHLTSPHLSQAVSRL